MEEVGKLLQQQLKSWRDYHALTAYLKHLSTVRFRYKFFVMVGDSMIGMCPSERDEPWLKGCALARVMCRS